MTAKQIKKLTPVSSISGMWNGIVFFKFMGCETQERIHVGLADSDKIKSGVSAEKVIAEIIEKYLGYPNIKIMGVKADRAMKKVASPFSK